MKDPKVNRVIGYIILFSGFGFLMYGTHYPTADDPYNGKNWFLIIISVVLMVYSLVWMIKKVRCPHCNQILHFKLYNIDVCPYCGRSTDPDDK